MGELNKVRTCQEILQLRGRRGHASSNLIAACAGEHDTNASLNQTGEKLLITPCARSRGGWESARAKLKTAVLPGRYVDVIPGATAFLFDLCEIGAFIPVRFRVVVIREGVESRSLAFSSGNQSIRHANDGG